MPMASRPNRSNPPTPPTSAPNVTSRALSPAMAAQVRALVVKRVVVRFNGGSPRTEWWLPSSYEGDANHPLGPLKAWLTGPWASAGCLVPAPAAPTRRPRRRSEPRRGRGRAQEPCARRRSARRPQQHGEGLRIARSRGRLDHRPDEHAHHVVQERVRADAQRRAPAGVAPGRLEHVASEDAVVRLGGREGAVVALRARQQRRAGVEQRRCRAAAARARRGPPAAGRGNARAAACTRRCASAPRSGRGSPGPLRCSPAPRDPRAAAR